jgi:hypothetical protein
VDAPKVPPLSAVGQLQSILASPEIAALVSQLEATRWTGRPGYPIRTMVGMALAKSLYAIPTWTKTVALVREHVALRLAICKWGEDPGSARRRWISAPGALNLACLLGFGVALPEIL